MDSDIMYKEFYVLECRLNLDKGVFQVYSESVVIHVKKYDGVWQK